MGINVPKKVVGQYEADIPDFEFEENGETKHATGFLLSIFLRENDLLYRAGSLEFKGKYTDVSQNGQYVDMKVNLFNNSSVTFDLDLIFDKKTNQLAVHGIKGIEEVVCGRRQVTVEKKTRFRRL